MSARKRQLVLTPDARLDLSDILLYTQEEWGKRQRAVYQARIDRTLRHLLRFPDLGRNRDEISPGLRSYPVGYHLILYRVGASDLTVTRIIHQQRDIEGIVGSASADVP